MSRRGPFCFALLRVMATSKSSIVSFFFLLHISTTLLNMSSGGSDDSFKDNVSTYDVNSNSLPHSDKNTLIRDENIDMEALNNLRSEAGLTQLVSTKNVRMAAAAKGERNLKRPKADQTHSQTISKVFNSETHSSLDSSSISTSGSSIIISENILRNRYSSDNQGPFNVHVQRISKPNAPLHLISVGRTIARLNISDVMEIRKVGFSKVSIFAKTQ